MPTPHAAADRSQQEGNGRMNMRGNAVAVATLLVAFSAASLPGAERYLVVAHPNVAVSSLPRAELSRLFLKRQTSWADGTPVIPVDLPLGTPLRKAFDEAVHERPSSAVEAYWQKEVFSGRSLPPLTRSSPDDVLAFVRTHPGAIGYVPENTPLEGVKILKIK